MPRPTKKSAKTVKATRKPRKAKSALKIADSLFSMFIRTRDGKCVRCGRTTSLQCSHFWPRGISATRYDEENCDTLCYACHYGNAKGWERAKQGEYRDFKIKQLGISAYQALEVRSRLIVKRKSITDYVLEHYKSP